MVKCYLTLTVLLSTVLGISPLSAQTEEMAERAIASPEVTQHLPANTALVLLLNRPQAWQSFNRFQSLDFMGEIFNEPGLLPFLPVVTLQEGEILDPWIDDWSATAVIPLSSIETETAAATVTLIPVSDEDAFADYLTRLEVDYGTSASQETYNDIPIQVFPQVEIVPDPMPTPPSPEMWQDDGEVSPANPSLDKSLSRLSHPLKQVLTAIKQGEGVEDSNFPPEFEFPQTAMVKPSVAIARLPNNLVVVAPSRKDIQGYLDMTSLAVPLAENPEFEKLLHHPDFSNAVVGTYGNFKQLAQLSRQVETQSPPGFPPLPSGSGFSQVADLYGQTYLSFNALIWADEAGGRLQFRSDYRNPQPEMAARSQNPNRLLSRLPGGTYVATNGINLGQSLLTLVSTVEGIPEIASVLDGVRGEIRQALGLELQDLLQWMDGEFALFLYPPIGGSQNALFPFLPFEIGLYLETGDRPAAEQVLSALDSWILNISEGFVEISRESLENQPFTSWNLPMGVEDETLSQVAHGWITEDTLLLTTGMASVNRLYPQPRVRLLDSYNFQTAIAPFPDNRTSLAYYNLGAIVAATRDLWRSPMVVFDDTTPLEGEEQPTDPFFEFLQSLRSLSLSVSIDEEREQLDIRLVLSHSRH
ncbi:MAG: DUF3352 domain-containing protein [Phormidium sp. SL48-SHIP]|nr:MAG: DUF3352 domain-containing protein [Phormidium sp. SL48-SHIP]